MAGPEADIEDAADGLQRTVPGYLYLCTADFERTVYAGPGIRELLEAVGVGPDASPRAALEAIDPAYRETVTTQLRAASSGHSVRVAFPLASERERWFEARAEPGFDDDDGTVTTVVVSVQSVPETPDHEMVVERYEQLLDTVGDPIYELDTEGRFTYVNEALVELLGYDAERLLGQHVSIAMADAEITETEAAIKALLASDGASGLTREFAVETASGDRIHVENHLTLLTTPEGCFRGTAGVLRDITEYRQRERELERTADMLVHTEHIAGVGGWELNVAEPPYDVTWTDGLFEIFGIEPRPSLSPAEVHSMVHPDDRAQVREDHERLLEDGDRMQQEYRILRPDGETRWVRVVSEQPADRPDIRRGATLDITAQKRYERKLERQRENLTALDTLNCIVRGITDAVIDQSTRAEIEQVTVERLAAADSYSFAWIADVDPASQEVTPRVEHGVDGYLDAITISADPNDVNGQGPAGRSIRTCEMQVCQHVLEDPGFAPWNDVAQEYGYNATASIPIVHEGTLYGVIGVYSERPDAFSAAERAVVGQLGEVVGHAIAAVERKQALLNERVVEITFQIRAFTDALGLSVEADGELSFDRLVPLNDEAFLVYGTATSDAVRFIEAMVQADSVPHWTAMTILGSDDERTRFEAKVTGGRILGPVVRHGGYVADARLDDGDLRLSIHLPTDVDVSAIIAAIDDSYPSMEMLRRRQVTRPTSSPGHIMAGLDERLTDRQRAAIEAAYFAGFFDWPRESSGEDVATSLGIGTSTFHQHLRKAEKKLLDIVFEHC